MGIVLDSGILIAAERQARPVTEVLTLLEQDHNETDIVLSSITVIELEHGFHRANTAELTRRRRTFIDAVLAAIQVVPFSQEMAQIAAGIDANAKRAGLVIPFPDLLIGCTALQLGYAVGTRNLRHFRMIPDLRILAV
jgi:predicted nucleic acid-binding protein